MSSSEIEALSISRQPRRTRVEFETNPFDLVALEFRV